MENIPGYNGIIEDVLKIWAKNAENWVSEGSPWRPSSGDIKGYQKLSQDKMFGKVLILGSTPELRDLAALHNAKTFVVDISYSMLRKMTLLTKHVRSENEVWINSDWCEAQIPEKYFDLVMGDMIWWVVSVDYQLKLRDKIASLLKPDGLFISRFRLRNAEMLNQDGTEIIKKYFIKFRAEPNLKKFLINAMLSCLYDLTADIAVKRIDLVKTKQFLEIALVNTVNEEEKEFIKLSCQNLLGAEFTNQARSEILQMLEEKFVLKNEKYAQDYESQSYPVLSFAKIA